MNNKNRRSIGLKTKKVYSKQEKTNNKSKECFIDPSMSLTEVKNRLKETVFSTENMAPISGLLKQNFLKYRRQYFHWETDENKYEEIYKIFDPLPYRGKYPVELIAIPYLSRVNLQPQTMCFCSFKHKKNTLHAALIDNEIEFYSLHSSDRFDERFSGNFISKRTPEEIGKMFIFNNMSWLKRYDLNGFPYYYDIVRDGIYCCSNVKGLWLRKTFISRDMLYPSQVKFYNENVQKLNKHLIQQGIPPINKIMRYSNKMAA